MSTVKAWFVEAKYGKITTFMAGDSRFTINLAKAQMFDTEEEAKATYEGSPHFGETPERLRHMACDSWLKRRYPHYTFRAVCLEIDTEDRKYGLFSQRNELVGRRAVRDRRSRLFSLAGLRRLSRFLRMEKR